MRMEDAEARSRVVRAQVLRLATTNAVGQPHIVPCTFALDDSGRIVIGIDNKPKSTANLRRLRNIEENPSVSVLVDHYNDDWDQLWWVRGDGIATIERAGENHAEHWDLLKEKYSQYSGQSLDGPVIVVPVTSWSGWTAT
jgi:PPOX class probable F420-dependent enzyme